VNSFWPLRSLRQFRDYFLPTGPCGIAYLVEMSDGHTVASTLMGSEGAVCALSLLSPSRSPVTREIQAHFPAVSARHDRANKPRDGINAAAQSLLLRLPVPSFEVWRRAVGR